MEKLASTTGDLRYFEPWNSNNTVHSNHSNYITTNSCPTPWRGNKPFKPRNHSPSSSEWPQNKMILAPSSESAKFPEKNPLFSGASRYRYFQVVPCHQSWVAEVPMVTGKNSLSMGLLPRPGHSRIKGLRGTFLDTKTVLPLGYEVPWVGIDHDKCATNPPPQDLDIVRLRRQGAVKSLTVVCLFQISLLLGFWTFSSCLCSFLRLPRFFLSSFPRFFVSSPPRISCGCFLIALHYFPPRFFLLPVFLHILVFPLGFYMFLPLKPDISFFDHPNSFLLLPIPCLFCCLMLRQFFSVASPLPQPNGPINRVLGRLCQHSGLVRLWYLPQYQVATESWSFSFVTLDIPIFKTFWLPILKLCWFIIPQTIHCFCEGYDC